MKVKTAIAVMICSLSIISSTMTAVDAATSIETIRLADDNIFYASDGASYRIKNESFYSSSSAVKGKAIEVITKDGQKLYIPK